jgi:hypothetical protein
VADSAAPVSEIVRRQELVHLQSPRLPYAIPIAIGQPMRFPARRLSSLLPANEIAVDLGTANTLV